MTVGLARGSYADILGALGAAGAIQRSVTTQHSTQRDVEGFLEAIEREVSAARDKAFTFASDGTATLVAHGNQFAAGRFSTPSIAELKHRLIANQEHDHSLTLSVFQGAHPLTDIGALQGSAGEGALFQAASQFNCLEAPGPTIVPVADYVHDYTQGPRASVSAFPGTFLRHYAAPAADGSRFVQTDERSIDLLAGVFDPSIAAVKGGYLSTHGIVDRAALAKALVDRFDEIRVGIHDEVEVVYGFDWSGPVVGARTIAQVFTSTIALGSYSRDASGDDIASARRQLLRGAYVGTLLAAASLEKSTVVLTLIGGGVFANPKEDIWEAIEFAVETVRPYLKRSMLVIVNCREGVDAQIRKKILTGGGAFVEFGEHGISVRRQ